MKSQKHDKNPFIIGWAGPRRDRWESGIQSVGDKREGKVLAPGPDSGSLPWFHVLPPPAPTRCNSRQCETADGPPVPSDCSCVAGGENKVWAVGVARKSWGSTHPRIHLHRGFRAVTASGRMLRAEGWERPPCD